MTSEPYVSEEPGRLRTDSIPLRSKRQLSLNTASRTNWSLVSGRKLHLSSSGSSKETPWEKKCVYTTWNYGKITHINRTPPQNPIRFLKIYSKKLLIYVKSVCTHTLKMFLI